MAKFRSRKLILLETNLDDMNPEWCEPLMERLFDAGAVDVTLQPIVMKKSRPAILLQVLALPRLRDSLLQIIFEHSTTLGIRTSTVQRFELHRSSQKVSTPYGIVEMKIGKNLTGRIINLAPEFETCKRLAKEKKVPIKKIYEAALRATRLDHSS